VAPDGEYHAELEVQYEKGDVADAVSGKVVLDTVSPAIEVSIDRKLFSPDGDNETDSIRVNQTSSEEVVFNGAIINSEGKPVKSMVWTGTLTPFDWDGTDDSGNRLPDGNYIYEVTGSDEAGNETQVAIRGIRIDTAPTPVYLTASQGYIKAGEIDPDRMQTFAAVVPNTDGIASWTFTISDKDGRSVYTESGTRMVPDGFSWNGTDSTGRPVEGVFKGVLSVVYAKGSKPSAESRPFISDGSPPEVTVTLRPQPFSPDGDNVDDEVVIGLTVEDRSRISEWSLEIFDPRGHGFITFSGRGRPSERIIWDGRSGRGELVQSAEDYPYKLTVSDVLGHTKVEHGSIAVDVLVIREGDRLKILINNITFQPSSPMLTTDGDEGLKNRQVLDRLAEIMQKYSSYRIVVEGHAVSLKWADPAAAEREQNTILVPLSRSRAQTVVDELIARGVPSNRMEAVGIGGDKPIVPHGDLEERWRNRRVEFYLEK
jgi:outer membrane protein OmpA-like peptidoglycan-associated protein/flagellar hook assembly protein FlgD